ncbi:hypothetical protein AMJ40_01705 [candidate division TA06 bacterium DG_26]|uniref:PPC domain-containing protein n=1 Tax=candidate division TA06 bacterium DG_26 TaxID=1703771 RepID=A0A0S7WL10_UNCT6|nr:MAG: hypothetical protein AMJ40_01705 [candidate division TA06 bacterium DG_26]
MNSIEDHLLVIKLKDGEDFFEGLRQELKKHGIQSGLIVSGIGMLRELTTGYFVGKGEYEKTRVAEPVELTSMQGNIATSADETVLHIHVTGATCEGKLVGGHLISGTVNVVNEIVLVKLDRTKLERRLSEKTGLLELFVLNR